MAKTVSLKAIKSARAKTYYYQLLGIKKAGVDTNTYMIKISDRQSLQATEFDCKGDLLDGIKVKLLPELFEGGKLVVHLVTDFPHHRNSYNVIKGEGFELAEKV